MAELELIGAPQSVYVRTARLALHEKGVGYRLTLAAPHGAEALAANPFGFIPVLRHKELTLFETRAITLYIDHAFEGPALTERDPPGAARVEQWVSVLATTVLPCWTQYTRAKYFPESNRHVDLSAVLARMSDQMAIIAEAITPQGYLGCDRFTLADIGLLPILDYLRQLPESRVLIEEAPAISTYFARHASRSSWLDTQAPPLPGVPS